MNPPHAEFRNPRVHASEEPGVDTRIGAILVRVGRLSPTDLHRVLETQRESGLRFGETACKLELLQQKDVEHALAQQYGLTMVMPGHEVLSAELCVAFDRKDPRSEGICNLRGQLVLRWRDMGAKTLALVGLHSGAGCTFVAANLAVAFAQLGQRVLLIDADLRAPRIDTLFGLVGRDGLADVLANRAGPEAIAAIAPLRGLYVLAAGNIPPNPQELLSGPGFGGLMANFHKQFDLVVVDAAPFGMHADATFVSVNCEDTVIVTRQNHSRTADAEIAKLTIERAGGRLAGTVLNDF